MVKAPNLRRSVMLLGLLAAARPGEAAPPPAGDYSKEAYRVVETRGHLVPMRDKVRLSVDLFRPEGEGPFPALLFITPYNNNGFPQKRARWFARRGYIVAAADSRGRFDSEGDWDPFDKRHKTDGYDLVEWLARIDGCTGKVGMLGQSYLGWTQWWTATQAPPSLVAIAPEVAPPDHFDNGPYQQGVLVSWAVDWAATMAGRTAQVVADGPYGGFGLTRDADYRALPYVDMARRRGAMAAPWFETWIRQPTSSGEYWRGIAYQRPEDYARVKVPSLSVTGWFDANHPGSPKNYLGVKKHAATEAARRPRLVIGPWQHSINVNRQLGAFDYGEEAVIDWDGYVCRWYDHYLKGVDNSVEREPPVYLFVMGRNKWRTAEDWPLPETRYTKYYLHSQGGANSLEGDGLLSESPPQPNMPGDQYAYDPKNPTPAPFKGGHLEEGAVDTRPSAARSDVLVYTTPPLEEDVEVIGPIEAKIFATTSARDTDWMVRLVDVAPDGYSALLCDGVMRARMRDPERDGAANTARLSAIEPGKSYEYTIRFWRGTANVFARGHRIRLEISSSYFPYYLPNLNTGADNIGLETTSVVAKQTIHHDQQRPSHVVLPIIPAGP